MTRTVYRRAGMRVVFRIGKRKAEVYEYMNGDDKNPGDLMRSYAQTPADAEDHMKHYESEDAKMGGWRKES